jgi:hypothetical protein
LRKAAFLLTPLLGLALFFTATPPRFGTHLSTRFLQDSTRETGLTPVLAVIGDYRSFDLLLLVLIAWCAGCLGLLAAFSRLPQVPLKGRALAATVFLSLGILGGLGIGLFTLWGGGDLLDFEPFARFVPPESARGLGAWGLSVAGLLCMAGVFLSCFKGPETSHGN